MKDRFLLLFYSFIKCFHYKLVLTQKALRGSKDGSSTLAVSHIYGSMFHCLNMVKLLDVNNSDLKDTGIASLKCNIKHSNIC